MTAWGEPTVAAAEVPADQLLEVTGIATDLIAGKAGGRPQLWSLASQETPLPEEADSIAVAGHFLATTRGDVTHLWTH